MFLLSKEDNKFEFPINPDIEQQIVKLLLLNNWNRRLIAGAILHSQTLTNKLQYLAVQANETAEILLNGQPKTGQYMINYKLKSR